MKHFTYSIALSLLTSLALHAQESLPISLETVLELGGANNLTIKEFQQKQKLAQAALTQADEWWYPHLYTGAKTHQLWGTSMNIDGTFNTDVSSDNLWLGVGANTTLHFADAKYKTQIAKLNVQAAAYTTQAQRNQALLGCVSTYYDLLNEQLKIDAYSDLAQQSQSIMEQINVQVQVGLRYQSELLLAKSNVAHYKLEVLNAKNSYLLKSSELVKLLNLKDTDITLESSDKVLIPLEFSSMESADYHNRGELKEIASTLQAIQTEKKALTDGLYLPHLSIDAYTSYFGALNGSITNADASRGERQLYPTSGVNLALLWKIPLGRLFSGGELEAQDAQILAQHVKSQRWEAQIKQEVKNAHDQITLGKEKILLAKEALETTAKALHQSIERQKLGTAKPFEVFQGQQFYLQAKIDYFKTIIDYNKAQFALKVAKGDPL